MGKLLNGYTHTLLITVSSYTFGMDIHLDAIYSTEFHKDRCRERSYTYYILHPLQMLLKGIKCLFYADDTQIYISFQPCSYIVTLDEVRSKIEACLLDINEWMTDRKLKLNNNKTELLIRPHTTDRLHLWILYMLILN